MAVVSILVATTDPGAALDDLTRSIDAQTLPAADFELVVVDASEDGTAERLQRFAERRPNVVVLAAAASEPSPDRIGRAAARARGDHLLVLGQHQRLAPRALELLVAHAGAAEVVLGRVVRRGTSGSTALPEDGDASGVDRAGLVALVRRAALPADAGTALLDPAGPGGTATALGRYACAYEDEASGVAPEAGSVEAPVLRWEAGALHLEAGVRPRGAPSRAWLVVADARSEAALPATFAADAGGTRVTAVVDPATALGGHPLDDGPWALRLRLALPGGEATLPIPAARARAAVVHGRPHVVRGEDGALVLDAGARRSNLLGRVPLERTSITESVDGVLAVLEHPDVHVHGDAVLPARLLLDRFGLPARLVCEGGAARLEARASGLAGISAVLVVAGGGGPVRTGLRLVVDGTGVMRFERVPPRAPDAPADHPLAQRLRRRVPAALDPALRRLVRVPAVRDAYRRLLTR